MLAIFIVEKILADDSILDIGDYCSDRLGISIVKMELFDSERDAEISCSEGCPKGHRLVSVDMRPNFHGVEKFSDDLTNQRYSAGTSDNLDSLKLLLRNRSFVKSLLKMSRYLLENRVVFKDLSFDHHI